MIGSRSKDKGLLEWLSGADGLPRGWKCPQSILPKEIQRACMRLGVPLSLFVDLMRPWPYGNFFGLTGDSKPGVVVDFPYQAHHNPVNPNKTR